MPKGKYFYIKSFLNGKVLDVYGGKEREGTPVKMYDQKRHGADNQLWTYHVHTNTIRSKLNGYCLDIKGGRMEMQPYSHGVLRFKMDDNKIAKRDDTNQVLDIVQASKENGAELCLSNLHGGDNQLWNKEHVDQPYFHIKSRMNGKVMDIYEGNRSSGAEVVMWKQGQSNQDNQLWYEDEEGWIRSKLNGYGFDTSGRSVTMQPHRHNDHNQQWQIEGEFIMNHAKGGEVLDIRGANKDDGAGLCSYKCNRNENQRWEFKHV